MEFEAQVPVQIRRTGRNNREGIDYSMAQWYPKLCEYDNKVGTPILTLPGNFMEYGVILM